MGSYYWRSSNWTNLYNNNVNGETYLELLLDAIVPAISKYITEKTTVH